MGVPEQATTKSSRLKIVIIILAVLLVLSAGGLVVQYVYRHFFAPVQSTATVPDNLIGGEDNESQKTPAENSSQSETVSGTNGVSATSQTGATGGVGGSGSVAVDKRTAVKLELYEGKPGDNQRFEVTNLLPGDTETKYFCVKAYHNKDIELFFKTNITEQTKNLGDALHIKVTHMESGKVLCDAAFNEINSKEFFELLKANGNKATTAYYQIDVSLDTSVGNEYQEAGLKADFSWYVKDEGELTPPQTGDTFSIALWVTLAGSSLLFLLFLVFRRRKEKQHA